MPMNVPAKTPTNTISKLIGTNAVVMPVIRPSIMR